MNLNTETRLLPAARILKKMQEAQPDIKSDILKRMAVLENERHGKTSLADLFHRKAFREGIKAGFAAPFIFLDNLINGKLPTARIALPSVPDVMSTEADHLIQALKDYCADNSDILEMVHLNNKERALLGLPVWHQEYDAAVKRQPG